MEKYKDKNNGRRNPKVDLDMEQESSKDKDIISYLGRDKDGSKDKSRNRDDTR